MSHSKSLLTKPYIQISHIFKTVNLAISSFVVTYSTSVSSHSTYSTAVLLWDSRYLSMYSEPGVSQVLHYLNYKVVFSMPPRPP